MLVSAVFLAYCDHEALMLGPWPPRGSILQLRGLHVATVAFASDVLLQESFFVGFLFFCCERLSASMARSLHLSFICIPQSTRALDQGGVEPRQAVSPKALRPWTIPLRYSVG